MEEKKAIGKITHFFSKINVAVLQLSDEVRVGDEISIEGPSTNVRQKIDSMQIEHKNIDHAVSGQSIGLKVADKVREGDAVYKIIQ